MLCLNCQKVMSQVATQINQINPVEMTSEIPVCVTVTMPSFAMPSFAVPGLSVPDLKAFVPTREILILGTFVAILQILDGILTGVGISHFGTAAEGNAIIRHLMDELGYINALILVKSFALAVVGVLCVLSTQVKWIGRALKVVILVYLSAAIIPWTAILISKLI